MKFMAAFQKEWLELVRTKRLLIALVVLVLFGADIAPDGQIDP